LIADYSAFLGTLFWAPSSAVLTSDCHIVTLARGALTEELVGIGRILVEIE